MPFMEKENQDLGLSYQGTAYATLEQLAAAYGLQASELRDVVQAGLGLEFAVSCLRSNAPIEEFIGYVHWTQKS